MSFLSDYFGSTNSDSAISFVVFKLRFQKPQIVEMKKSACYYMGIQQDWYLLSMCMLICFRCVQLFVTLWTIAHQTPLFMGSPVRNTGVGCMPSSSGSYWPRDPTHISNVFCRFFTASATWEAHLMRRYTNKWTIQYMKLQRVRHDWVTFISLTY